MTSGRQSNVKKSSKGSAGTKKTGGRKSTTQRSTVQKSTAGRTKSAASGRKNAKKNSQLQDEITVLLAFACAIILILSNFNLAGSVGESIKWFMFGLFGIVQYIFPVIMAVTILFMISNRNLAAVARVKAAAVYILSILIAGGWQRIYDEPVVAGSSVWDFFISSAEHKNGGGLFGGLICKMLSPFGTVGSMVIIVILAIICIIVITEKSFISGLLNVKDSGSRMVKAAKQDYDMYREHSNEKLSQDKERAKRKREENEQKSVARMYKKALGVTNDTQLPKESSCSDDIDINEIVVDTERDDEFSGDIYEPLTNTSISEMTVEPLFEPEYADEAEVVMQFVNEPDTIEEYVNEPEVIQEYVPEHENSEMITASVDETGHGNIDAQKKEYVFPPISLLNKVSSKGKANQLRENQNTAMRLQQTLQNFGVKVTITDISCGPSVTRYELQPEQGVKVSKIVSLSDDIKLNLAAADIRIEAPIPGKAAIGIEVPNKEAGSVSLRELLESDTFKNHQSAIAFAAGKDIAGKTIVADIAKMPHLLIAGATGSGKSVCINTIIMSILYKANPDDVKLIMVDPKVVELSVYNGIPHLLIPVVTDPKKASGALNWAVAEMTDRYKKFARMNVRDLKGYNAKIEKLDVGEGEEKPQKMPQIVIIIDELADLMMVAPGEVEDSICRLAQLARAAGIHLVIATQRPSVNVITGLIKANVPSRIAFSVSSGVDSRTIIDMNGAEKLLGKGDMLFYPSGYPKPVRVQGAFVSDEEVGKVVDFLKANLTQEIVYDEQITNAVAVESSSASKIAENERDPYFAEAGRFVIEKEKGSIGMLQRYYKIGFNRAGRIMDQLAEAGVVGPELGTKPRKVEMTLEDFENYLKNSNIG